MRQLYLDKFINEYGYAKNRIQVEYPVAFGSDINSKKADICILCDEQQQAERKSKDPKASNEYIIIELKNSKVRSGIEQLKAMPTPQECLLHSGAMVICKQCITEKIRIYL